MPLNKDTYAEIGRKLRELPPEEPEPSYEWEELVENLCSSHDSGLHDIGLKEQEELKQKHSPDDAGKDKERGNHHPPDSPH